MSDGDATPCPTLRFLPIGEIRPHEASEGRRAADLSQRIASDGVLRNPVVVAELSPGEYVLIDGTHRYESLADAGYDVLLAQLAPLTAPTVIDIWCHAARVDEGRFLDDVAAAGLDARPVDARSAEAALAGLLALAYGAGTSLPFFPAIFLEPTAIAIGFTVTLLVFVVSVSRAPAWAQWPLTNRVTFWFSEISFSVYIYHSLAIVFAFETLGVTAHANPRSFLTLAAVVLPLTLAVAVVSYRFVEVPGRAYGRKAAARFAGRPDRASAAMRSKWASRRRSSSGVRP